MMWKVATILSLLLVPAAFGSVGLSLSPAEATIGLPGGNVTATVNLAINGDTVKGVGLYLATDTDGVTISNRTVMSTKLTFATYDDAAIYAMNMKYNPDDTSNLLDVGLGQKNATTVATATEDMMTLTFTVPAASGKRDIKIFSPYALYDGTGDGSVDYSVIGMTIHQVPEPASMMLLAAGAAFFARRRRA